MSKPQTRGTGNRKPPGATAVEPEQLGEVIHALRNGMNSLLMNAAVLAVRIEDVPESLRPFIEGISKAGNRCSETRPTPTSST